MKPNGVTVRLKVNTEESFLFLQSIINWCQIYRRQPWYGVHLVSHHGQMWTCCRGNYHRIGFDDFAKCLYFCLSDCVTLLRRQKVGQSDRSTPKYSNHGRCRSCSRRCLPDHIFSMMMCTPDHSCWKFSCVHELLWCWKWGTPSNAQRQMCHLLFLIVRQPLVFRGWNTTKHLNKWVVLVFLVTWSYHKIFCTWLSLVFLIILLPVDATLRRSSNARSGSSAWTGPWLTPPGWRTCSLWPIMPGVWEATLMTKTSTSISVAQVNTHTHTYTRVNHDWTYISELDFLIWLECWHC